MAFDREAALKDGYTNEEIDSFLGIHTPPKTVEHKDNSNLVDTMHQAYPASAPMTPEQSGMAQFGAAQAAKYLGELGLGAGSLYGLYKGVKNIAGNRPQTTNIYNQMPGAAPQTQPLEPGGQQLKDFTTQQGQYATRTPQVSAAQSQLPNMPPANFQSNPQPVTGGAPLNQQVQTPQNSPMSKFGEIAQQYGPLLRQAAPIASRALGAVGGLTYSSGLNQGEDEAMRRIHKQQDESKQINDRVRQAALNRIQ